MSRRAALRFPGAYRLCVPKSRRFRCPFAQLAAFALALVCGMRGERRQPEARLPLFLSPYILYNFTRWRANLEVPQIRFRLSIRAAASLHKSSASEYFG